MDADTRTTDGARRACGVRTRSGGFSLVELMVAMTLGVILLSGVLAVFLGSRSTYETTDRLSRVQDNGRFALDTLVRDVRSAGYIGCSRRGPLTVTLGSPDDLQWDFALPISGFNAQDSTWQPTLDTDVLVTAVASEPTTGSDVLVMHIPDADFEEPVRVLEGSLMSATTSDLETEDTAASLLAAGDIVQISDCNARTIFQVQGNAGGVITHGVLAASGTSNLPGNTTADLGYAFTDAAEIIPLQSVVYYVSTASSPAAGTSLWRLRSGASAPEELAEGIENMQLMFGEADGTDLIYRNADEVNDWLQVRIVRVALLVRSTSQYGTEIDSATYQLLDTSIQAPGDRHLRQVFTTTIGIRNNPS